MPVVANEINPTTPGTQDAVETITTVADVPPTVGLGQATQTAISEVSRGNYDFLSEYASKHLGPAVVYAAGGLAVVFIGYLVGKYLSRVISKPVRRRVDETLGKFVEKMIFYGVTFGVIAAVLSKLGAPLGGLAAMLAAAGFAVGLAFQGTLSNFAAGVLMLVFRPFKVGDVVSAAGVTGKINEIDLFTTTFDTPDNRRIIVPNSAISGGTIENISYHPHRRIEVVVGVDYSADITDTRKVLETAAETFADQTIQGEGRGSAVVLSNLGDSAVEWKVRIWVDAADYWSMLENLTAEVKRQLDAAKIGIPFPQLDIHLDRVDLADDSVRQRPRVRPVRRGDTDESINQAG